MTDGCDAKVIQVFQIDTITDPRTADLPAFATIGQREEQATFWLEHTTCLFNKLGRFGQMFDQLKRANNVKLPRRIKGFGRRDAEPSQALESGFVQFNAENGGALFPCARQKPAVRTPHLTNLLAPQATRIFQQLNQRIRNTDWQDSAQPG